MKRILVSFIAVMLGMVGFSQSVIIRFKDGSFEKHKMSLIESIEFVEDNYETSASIYLEKAGTLSSKLSKSQASELLKLKLYGHMDARDFDYIKWDCMKIEEVDLSDVVIDSYSGVEGTEEGNNKTYAANEIPSGAFFYWKDVHKYTYDGMPIEKGMESLKKVVLPQGITAIRRNAFAGAINLTKINIPEGVQSIDLVAFNFCTSLEELRLPSTLINVGQWVFANMNSLKKVYISAKVPPTASDNIFDNKPSNAVLYVPNGIENQYRNAVGWNRFTNIVGVGDTPNDGTNNEFGKVADIVDLGLSVKWASWNIGATRIADYGGLYGVGDPTGKRTNTSIVGYHRTIGECISGTEYDLATVKWGDKWRIPTIEELKELWERCTWESNVIIDGVKGVRGTGPNGNQIFIPCAGTRQGSVYLDKDRVASIWSGNVGSDSTYGYEDLDLYYSGTILINGNCCYFGQSIRPVYVGESTDTNDEGSSISSTNYLEVTIDGQKYTQQYELPFVAITLPSDVDNSLWLSSSVEEEFGGNLNFGIAIYHKSDINALLGSSTGTYNVIGNKKSIWQQASDIHNLTLQLSYRNGSGNCEVMDGTHKVTAMNKKDNDAVIISGTFTALLKDNKSTYEVSGKYQVTVAVE